MNVRRLLRAVAIAIALAGVIDPAITTSRRVKPEVGLLAADPVDAAVADRVSRTLSAEYAVVRGTSLAPAAVVAIGRGVPAESALVTAPVFAVIPDSSGPRVAIEALDAPRRAAVQARVPVTARVRVSGAPGSRVVVTLRQNEVALDRVVRDVATADELATIGLAFVGAGAGLAPVTVTAEIADSRTASARADVAVDVRDSRWAVLCFDGRPSWMSTFVRRALEADPRFVVTSRTATSRGASVVAGTPPAALGALPSLALFDAVLVGAPETLDAADVRGLERYLRERGGAVLLLLDQELTGHAPFEQLAGVTAWTLSERAAPVSGPSDPSLESSADLTPRIAAPELRRDLGPAIWQTAVGTGRLIVSGALDAWRYRDRRTDAFDRWWRTTVADAAGRTPRSLDIWLDRAVLAPGEATRLRAQSGPTGLDPDLIVRAPATPGLHEVEFTHGGVRARTSVAVVPGARPAVADDRQALEQWARSRGGTIFSERQSAELVAALDRALPRRSEPITWHPMRSAWWLLPFAGVLGAEWTVRRRSGDR